MKYAYTFTNGYTLYESYKLSEMELKKKEMWNGKLVKVEEVKVKYFINNYKGYVR